MIGSSLWDFEGDVLKQNIVGHVKYLSVADFDIETPGMELISSNSWGSDGLVHISDVKGTVKQLFASANRSQQVCAVNWKGDGEEFFVISADSLTGGLFDKYGALSVQFPDDGHPVTCYHVADLSGDARDELLVWNQDNLWIYTQDDNPRMGRTYNPDRIHSLQPFHERDEHFQAWLVKCNYCLYCTQGV